MERHFIDNDAVAQRYRYILGLSSVGDRGGPNISKADRIFRNYMVRGPNISNIFGSAGPEIGGTDYAVTGPITKICVVVSFVYLSDRIPSSL